MDETMKNTVENEEEVNATEEEKNLDDQLKEAIEAQMKKIQTQSMLLGAQTMCRVVLDKITTAMNQPGKRTMADYKRLVKDIDKFCCIGISRKVNADGETEPVEEESAAEETVQN